MRQPTIFTLGREQNKNAHIVFSSYKSSISTRGWQRIMSVIDFYLK